MVAAIFCGGRRKIDATCNTVSLIKNSRNGACDADCIQKRQLPARFAQITSEKRDISAKTRGALQ
jgi:hypothetical protein